MSPDVVVKRRGSRAAGSIGWEVAGLAWLRAAVPSGGAAVVEVLEHDEDHLTEPRLAGAPPSRSTAEAFGRCLAATHRFGAAGFGAQPAGWKGDGFIGDEVLPMPDEPLGSWGEFHARWRVEPFARAARDRGSLSAAGARDVARVCERLVVGDFDHGEVPARIHGDLWSGNVLWTSDGAVLIDPASHGGDAEADLAMLHLFGAPHLTTISAAWAEAYGAAGDWRERIGLHQLHPLLVHAVLFGGGYGAQAAEAAARYC